MACFILSSVWAAAALEILRAGSETAKAAAAQTLDKMKHAMMIDYFA